MNSPAPDPDPSPTGNPAGGQSAPAPGPAPHDAICTPVLPPRIRIPFLVLEFECGSTHYRSRPVDLVAEAVQEECGMRSAECGVAEAGGAEAGRGSAEDDRESGEPLVLEVDDAYAQLRDPCQLLPFACCDACAGLSLV